MSGWGSKPEWPSVELIPPSKPVNQQWSTGGLIFKEMTKEEFQNMYPNEQLGKLSTQPREYNNLKPTHDPYTNPNTHIYYECLCGAILDPCTKSFAALNNAASSQGWKIRWGAHSYIPYCVGCGKDVE